MTQTTALQRVPDVVFQTLAGEEGNILLHLGTGQYHSLNQVGARIWDLLESPRTELELSLHLASEFSVDPDLLARDIRTFLRELEERALVREVPIP
jgi:hypothetical protein